MATRKPLVMGSDGLPQALQPGDDIGIVTESGQATLTAAATLIPGNAVYPSAVSTCAKAQANAKSTASVIGLAMTNIASAGTGVIQLNGRMTLSTAQWDAVTGATGGLVFGTYYFLDPTTAGKITPTAPSTVGQVNVLLGQALSTTDMVLDPKVPILL